MAKYHQGKYTPRNPGKYKGNPNDIVYRSSWEAKFMRWLDENQQVIFWSSETTIVPYKSPIDNRMHRYFVDFKMQLTNNQGITKTYLVEIKPEKQTVPPVPGKRKSKYWMTEVQTYGVNQAKWAAAQTYALDRGYEFIILTERHLNI